MNNTKTKRRVGCDANVCTVILVAAMLVGCSSRDDVAADQDSLDASDNETSQPLLGPPLGGQSPFESSMPSPTSELVPKSVDNAQAGAIYTDENGFSLYIRHTDLPEKITCTLSCTQFWEPLITSVTTTGISGDFDIILRDDGASQWMLLNYPLYLHRGDATAGSVLGDGFENEWALARPVPTSSNTVDGEEALVALGATLAGTNSSVRANRDGYTLYVFDNDVAGTSSCTGACATNWPPLYADTGVVASGRYSVIARDDGSAQWAYDGKALYFWQGDSAAGEFSGASVANWNVARP